MSSNHKDDPAIQRANRKYQILGLHGDGVATVSGNVARVRMYVGDEQVDEDFSLPQIITVEQQLDEAINARIAELTNERIAKAAEQGQAQESEASQ